MNANERAFANSRFPIFVHGLGAYPEARVAERIEHRLRAELGRFDQAIELVRVYVEDVNGPRGGVDEVCRIVVQLPPRGCVAVTGRGESLLAAVRVTAARAAQAVKRHVQRRKTLRRRGRTQLAS
jgi:putative sigma-54 modulation protein